MYSLQTEVIGCVWQPLINEYEWMIIVVINQPNPLTGTLKPHSDRSLYSNTVIGTLAVWWVGCYIWYSNKGPGRAAAPPSPLSAVPNVTARPSTVSVPTSYYSMWHYNCLWTLKGSRHIVVDKVLFTAFSLCPTSNWVMICYNVCTFRLHGYAAKIEGRVDCQSNSSQ